MPIKIIPPKIINKQHTTTKFEFFINNKKN